MVFDQFPSEDVADTRSFKGAFQKTGKSRVPVHQPQEERPGFQPVKSAPTDRIKAAAGPRSQ